MKNPKDKIDKIENLLNSLWSLIKSFWIDFKSEIIELYIITKTNLINWNISKKIATVLILLLVFIPIFKTYWWYIIKWYKYIIYLKNYESIKEELANWYELSVKKFFNTYNLKYWVDCNWIAKVNVDSNMYEKHWTTFKERQNCALVNKMQIYPITIWNPIIDKSSKKVTISWKALILVLDWDLIKILEYKNYNLWKMLDWKEKDLWKFNSFGESIEIFKD